MSEQQQAPTSPYPADLPELAQRAQGDPAALAELRQVLDQFPELSRMFGDLSRHAEMALLRHIAPQHAIVRESAERQLTALKQELLATAITPLERLLVERVALNWLALHQAEIHRVGLLSEPAASSARARAADRAVSQAQARYLSAIKALATAQKLLRPARPTLELLGLPARHHLPGNRGASLPTQDELIPVLN